MPRSLKPPSDSTLSISFFIEIIQEILFKLVSVHDNILYIVDVFNFLNPLTL